MRLPRAYRFGTGIAVLAVVLCAAPRAADAGKHAGKTARHDIELVRPTAAPDADAAGVLRITVTKRGEQGLLRLRDLDPKTRYEVHDADTDEVLGTLRTDRRGKAKMKLRRRVDSAGKRATFEVPDRIEICRVDDDTPLLIGSDGIPSEDDLPAFGFEFYEGADGWTAAVDMFSFAAEGMEGFHLSLNGAPTERGMSGDLYEYTRDTFAGDDLPLGVASVADLSGRAFRVIGPDGTVYVRGVLPDLERPILRMPPIMDFPEFPDLPGIDLPERPAVDGTTRGAGKMSDRFLGPPEDAPGFDGDFNWDVNWNFDWDWDLDRGYDCAFPGEGDMPEIDDLLRMLPPDCMPFPQPEREPSRLRLEIADDDGTLTDCGNLDRIVFPEFDWPVIDWPAPPVRDPDAPDGTDRPGHPDWRCPMGEGTDSTDGTDAAGNDTRPTDAATR